MNWFIYKCQQIAVSLQQCLTDERDLTVYPDISLLLHTHFVQNLPQVKATLPGMLACQWASQASSGN
jgi:hypothetical protein